MRLHNLGIVLGATALAVFVGNGRAHASDICGDVNDSGGLTTGDALLVLRASVGQPVMLICESVPAVTTFGYTTDFVTSDTFGAGFLLGIPIEIDQQATVTHFGVIAKDSGQMGRFALYTDNGGEPGDLVIGSSPTLLTGGLQEFPVPATQVDAGTYWFMAVYDQEATMGVDFDGVLPVKLRPLTFETPFPASFGPSSGYTGDFFNYYVKVQL